MKKLTLARRDAPSANEINGLVTYLFLLRENKKTNDINHWVKMVHELLAKIL